MLYHGVTRTAAGSLYRLGAALFDLETAEQCLLRGDAWIFGQGIDATIEPGAPEARGCVGDLARHHVGIEDIAVETLRDLEI